MKIKLTFTFVFALILAMAGGAQGQVMVPCLTMEQTQAQFNQQKANSIAVRDTASQQLQCHYAQLSCYWNQREKDNQQKLKDSQQISKDIQQKLKDEQQKMTDLALAERLAALQIPNEKYDELVAFIAAIMPLLGNCSTDVKNELARIHNNRSGHADGTNPGGQTHNIRGFDNPGFVIAR